MNPDDPQAEIARLIAEIEHHNRLYYDQAEPEVSDAEYDALYRRLETLEACANCIRLLVYMPSLLAEHAPVASPNPNLAGLSE